MTTEPGHMEECCVLAYSLQLGKFDFFVEYRTTSPGVSFPTIKFYQVDRKLASTMCMYCHFLTLVIAFGLKSVLSDIYFALPVWWFGRK